MTLNDYQVEFTYETPGPMSREIVEIVSGEKSTARIQEIREAGNTITKMTSGPKKKRKRKGRKLTKAQKALYDEVRKSRLD